VSVYVDDMRANYGRMVMCHMIADTLEELLGMADKIGVQRKWLQDAKAKPHFDIALVKRALAVSHGAKEITLRQCATMSVYRMFITIERKAASVWETPLPAPEDSLRLMQEFRARRSPPASAHDDSIASPGPASSAVNPRSTRNSQVPA
jgi:hypothetical protein